MTLPLNREQTYGGGNRQDRLATKSNGKTHHARYLVRFFVGRRYDFAIG